MEEDPGIGWNCVKKWTGANSITPFLGYITPTCEVCGTTDWHLDNR